MPPEPTGSLPAVPWWGCFKQRYFDESCSIWEAVSLHFRGATGRGRAAADARWALQSTSEDAACLRSPGAPREASSPASPGLEAQPRSESCNHHPVLFALGSRSSQRLQPRGAPCCSPGPKGQRAPTPRGGPGRPPCVTPRTHRLRRQRREPPCAAPSPPCPRARCPCSQPPCEDGPPGCRIWFNSISGPS